MTLPETILELNLRKIVPGTLAKFEPRRRLERLENPTNSFVGVSKA